MTSPTDNDESASAGPGLSLTEVEARVLGSLMEKQRTTPANYPLTLNSLVLACNQKSSREPVMTLYEGDVGHVVNQLRDRNLIRVAGLSRVERYHQKLSEALRLDEKQQAVLCVLMLRGALTLNEIRTNTARLADFDDLDDLKLTLMDLAERDAPLILKFERQPGQREDRYAHLLCGMPSAATIKAASRPDKALASSHTGSSSAQLEARVDQLEARLLELEQQLRNLIE